MKHQGARDRTRISLTFGDEEDKALRIIKAHYGTSSPHFAIRKAIVEHAKHIKCKKEEQEVDGNS